ncbi:16S rRNA (cytidine(1402)-2'-O)-methyltransferase [Spirobacillus cienkowskii]|jgi:16S rRNA (cytidine1402-2'-O)-methyltransferase|uniref:Ribosomal RNA small subunit methyltransferase I n=1 Tax=Spirobacillus cienkowskii TaxID=495820 RepID=A0A369KRF9_9BACT|nr:MAG: 16S rRNA (cytidine(1402)-2'-O)-methyltransferase [Spirobacillus cienkowskii]
MSNGTLYIVATPIGTLNDFSPRAKEILSNVSFIACEDTRHSGKLLNHFGIKTHLESFHSHNEKNKTQFLIDKLLSSQLKNAAIISDAGTPCISDPGSTLIAAAHTHDILVQSIPGPSSMTAALAACGFLQPRSIFSAFLGRTQKEQFEEFRRWKNVTPCIAIFFESPKRLLSTLKNINEFFQNSNLQISVSKEISKKFESHKVGNIIEVTDFFKNLPEIIGEFVVCVNIFQTEQINPEENFSTAIQEVQKLIKEGVHLKFACKEISKKFNLQSKDLYNFMISKN